MAFGRETTEALIKPLEGSITCKFTAGSSIAAGELVSVSSDGFVDPSDSTAAKNPVIGVAVQSVGVGIMLDVVVYGPVVCLREATPGGLIYNSTTAGEPSETTAGNQTAAGVAKSATVLFVRPSNA